MKKRVTYEEMIKNKRLTDYKETKEIVINSQVKELPSNDKRDKSKYVQQHYV